MLQRLGVKPKGIMQQQVALKNDWFAAIPRDLNGVTRPDSNDSDVSEKAKVGCGKIYFTDRDKDEGLF
ncbi:MAG: hypothetical protein NT027_01560 [Proteobacteria bacterium]|nr:hypothetical protein [Pseudomonadota bacterium]